MKKVAITAPSKPNLTDLSLLEVHCFECGKPIPSIPSWLSGAKVKFQCEECRQKHPRIPGMADVETRRPTAELEHLADLPGIVEEEEPEDEDVEDDVVEEAADAEE